MAMPLISNIDCNHVQILVQPSPELLLAPIGLRFYRVDIFGYWDSYILYE